MREVQHIPVLKNEMLEWLAPKDGGVYIDGTFGAGGYSRAILESAKCKVFAIDRDSTTQKFADVLQKEYSNRFAWLLGNFSDMCELVASHGVTTVDGVVLDLGVSSMQLDQPERGFSFMRDGDLDMRMGNDGASAAEIVNNADEDELADIFYYYGEEKLSRRVAKAIVAARTISPITRTLQLAEIIRSAVPAKNSKTHPATRSFQGLRIYVNKEFDAIQAGLEASTKILNDNGRLVVVSFHSLEDRIVKRFTHSRCGKLGEHSRHLPDARNSVGQMVKNAPSFFLPKPEKKIASEAELKINPRSRSATIRMMAKGSL